jgi:hypothetical protein
MDTVQRPADLDWVERVEPGCARFVLTPSRMSAVPILVFAGVWDSFLVTLITALARSPRTPAYAFLLPALHAAVGVLVTWLALVRSLNRFELTLDRQQFALASSPVPSRSVRAPSSDIDRFEAHAKGGFPRGPSWHLRLRLRDGRTVHLPVPLDGSEESAFVAARLNQALAAARS